MLMLGARPRPHHLAGLPKEYKECSRFALNADVDVRAPSVGWPSLGNTFRAKALCPIPRNLWDIFLMATI
jgi:hypothetical protein